MFKVPDQHRRTTGPLGSPKGSGNNGSFQISKRDGIMFILATDGLGWEHVSVSFRLSNGTTRNPTWDEMCEVKNLFWDEEDTVIQYHPAKKDYVNMHPNVLHLWRPIGQEFPKPDKLMVGW